MTVIDLPGWVFSMLQYLVLEPGCKVSAYVYVWECVPFFLFLIFSILSQPFEHEAFQKLSKLIIICYRVTLLSTISNFYMRKITHVLRKHGILKSFSSGPLVLAGSLAPPLSLPPLCVHMYVYVLVCFFSAVTKVPDQHNCRGGRVY